MGCPAPFLPGSAWRVSFAETTNTRGPRAGKCYTTCKLFLSRFWRIQLSRVLIENSPSPLKLEVLGVDDWPVAMEPAGESERYCPHTETSYIESGAGHILVEGDTPLEFAAGDLVTVMPDTRCVWNITEAIERHYYKG
jgi:hypothetical protein